MHDGIVIIESGLIRSYYTAPSGKEITLAYWLPGNFVGGPEIFDGGVHVWSAVAAKNSTVTHLPGAGLRDLAREVPDLALEIIDALSFKARCYSSLAQMLGTRSLSQRLAQVLLHLANTYGFEDEASDGGVVIAAAFTHAEISQSHRCDAAMGDDQPQSPAEGRRAASEARPADHPRVDLLVSGWHRPTTTSRDRGRHILHQPAVLPARQRLTARSKEIF